MNDNLVQFFRQRPEVFPLRRDIDLQHLLSEAVEDAAATLPMPAKIFLVDELEPHSYGFPVTKSPALDDLSARLEKWIEEEIASRMKGNVTRGRTDELLQSYRSALIRLAHNALHSSILADYHAVFWD